MKCVPPHHLADDQINYIIFDATFYLIFISCVYYFYIGYRGAGIENTRVHVRDNVEIHTAESACRQSHA